MVIYFLIVSSSYRVVIFFVFFFQAEDGIRDLVRSRGLGDVYKRQRYDRIVQLRSKVVAGTARLSPGEAMLGSELAADPVSYTHLTLPTSDLV